MQNSLKRPWMTLSISQIFVPRWAMGSIATVSLPQSYANVDWAHFEDFCRRLTNKYASVKIFTGPLYLPRQYPDGKWRVTYEVIGNPPSVAVPTHFFKVIVAEGKSVADPVHVGAFVLPNQEINNATALTSFIAPVEAVERCPLSIRHINVERVDWSF
jgi:DNA/RNA endonuclease G (NUC1)